MAGTINISLSQQFDRYGEPLDGGQLYFFVAGTVATPQNAYQDLALTILHPNPIVLDAAGRVPQFFLADGQIKIRLQDKDGVIVFVADNVLVIGPSSGGGGGGGGVDPTTVFQTGDVKFRYDNTIQTGFVRANGRTIGNAASGATELADPTAQALFNYLWAKDPSLVVAPGGRGASASADWTANKTIALPDGRARLLMALADMGATDVGLLAGVSFSSGNSTTLGSKCGLARRTIDATIMPAHQHNVYLRDPGHFHKAFTGTIGGAAGGAPPLAGINTATGETDTDTKTTGITIGSVSGVANDNKTTTIGSGNAFDIVSPVLLITVYVKL